MNKTHKVMKSLFDTRKIVLFVFAVSLAAMFMATGAKAGEYEDLQALIDQCIEQKNTAHQMAECARKLGYGEDHVIIMTAKAKWSELNDLQNSYVESLKIKDEQMEEKRREYPYATHVYERLKEAGLSDEAVFGVLGNMMTEVGGHTLALQPFIYGRDSYGSYYGLCQWSLYYNPTINGKGVDEQIDYLLETIGKNMKYFGGSYEHFKNMKDAGAAARYYNTYYGRGNGNAVRAVNAQKALEYYR